jgi:hypothetical protein
MTGQRTISVLGATGSIGASTLDLVRRNPDAFRVVALTANAQAAELAALAREFRAEVAVVADEARLPELRDIWPDRAWKPRAARRRWSSGRAGGYHRGRDRRVRGSCPHHGGDRTGQGDRAGQQGSTGFRRRGDDRGGRPDRGHAAAGRFRTQRDLPVPAGQRCRQRPLDHADGQRRPFRDWPAERLARPPRPKR